LTGDHIPKVTKETSLRKTILVLNEKNLGAVLIVDNRHKLDGIITDGDIRRLVTTAFHLDGKTAADEMIANPKTIEPDLLAADALSIMQRFEITILPVIDADHRLQGILHLHNLIGKGEFRFLV
jgi:arabinose-5-phosphate isomerase